MGGKLGRGAVEGKIVINPPPLTSPLFLPGRGLGKYTKGESNEEEEEVEGEKEGWWIKKLEYDEREKKTIFFAGVGGCRGLWKVVCFNVFFSFSIANKMDGT